MELIEGLRSTGASRAFTDQPVDESTIAAVLDDARFAPSGGNRQPWRVAVVQNPATRRAMADLMTPIWHEYMGANAAGERAFAFGLSIEAPPVAAPNPLLDHIETVPVVLAIAADLREIAIMDGNLTHRPAIVGGASIYPFCWSLLLAARARGLGAVMTTFLSRAEQQAGPLLALPEHHALVATIFVGYPTHQNTKLRRKPVSEFTTINRFDGDVFGAE